MTPERLPPRLQQLGFQGSVIGGVEVILPPVCLVPSGLFLMGSDPTRDPIAKKTNWTVHEMPQHSVTLPSYDIARFPVTVAEYACFVRAAHPEPQDNKVSWPTQLLSRLDHPVVNVTWQDAIAYAVWLAECTGERFRLPTEAEWEKAARSDDGRIYPWGDAFDKTRCNTVESRIQSTTPVGSYPAGASPYGAEDMAGNVFEWTSTRYFPFAYATSGEPKEEHAPETRVERGGSWGHVAWFARAAFRDGDPPELAYDYQGFRLVRRGP